MTGLDRAVQGSQEAGGAADELPFSIAVVEDMMKALMKAVRAHQLYLRNNPMYLRALDLCKAAFVPLWDLTDEITFAVTETELRWCDRVVLLEADKGSDSLAWLLYKDGVRELQLLRGFEEADLVRLLDIVQRVRRASPDEDDLITMLWEQDFAHLRYKYVELGPEGVAGIEKAPFEQRQVEVAGAVAAAAESAPPGIVNMRDFDSTLYFLDPGEVSYLQSEIIKEYTSELRTNVTAILLDIFESQADDKVRDEVLELLEYFLVHLLASQNFPAVSYMLRECAASAERAKALSPAQQERLATIPDRMSEPESLLQMLQALEDSPSLPAGGELDEILTQLRPLAMAPVLSWITRSQNAKLKPLLESAATRLASTNTAELVKLILVDDRDVRLEAMRRSAALRSAAAVGPLSRVASDPDVEARLAAVTALGEIGSAGAMQALERCVEDAERDVRVTAVRALAAQQYRPALPRVEASIKGRQLREADLTEKMAFFEAYGALAGENGVPYLDGILNGKGLFGKKEEAEERACAALALGRIGSERALAALQKASGEKDVVVRSSINKALRGTAP